MRYEKVLWRACVPLGRQILIEELFCDYVEPPEHSSISNKDGGGLEREPVVRGKRRVHAPRRRAEPEPD